MANDSEYGLHGAVFTSDLERGLGVSKRIRSGTFAVNGYGTTPYARFGGVKASGLGPEHGREVSTRTWSRARSTSRPSSRTCWRARAFRGTRCEPGDPAHADHCDRSALA